MPDDPASIPYGLPIVDLGVAVVWVFISFAAWIGYRDTTEAEGVDERALGAAVIMGQLGAVITGSSVVLAGIGAFVALETSPISPAGSSHLSYGASWAVVALAIALFTMGILPSNAPKKNFVRIRSVAILCSTALFFSLAAGFRFMLAVWSILLP